MTTRGEFGRLLAEYWFWNQDLAKKKEISLRTLLQIERAVSSRSYSTFFLNYKKT